MKSGMMPRGESALAQAVAAARRQGVDAEVLARVQANALAAAAAEAAPTALASSGSAWWWKHGALIGGGVMVLAGALQLRTPEPTSGPARVAAPAAVVRSVAAAERAPEVLPAPEVASSLPSEPAPPVTAASEARVPARPRAARPAPILPAVASALPAAPDAAGELALLRSALTALPSQPTRALELAEQHAATHPRGVFAQEREAIAIDACLALQRTGAAEARVRRFLAAWPRSPHAPRMRALLGEQEHAPAPTHPQAPTARRKEIR